MQIIEANPPIFESDIGAFETRIGHPLPPQYRRFLASTNGGRILPNRLSFYRTDIEEVFTVKVDWFLGLIPEKNRDMDHYRHVYRDRTPPELLAIAYDPGGNLICIAINGDSYGTICYWDHDFEVEEGETPNYRNISRMARDFQTLMDGLC